MLNNGDGNAYPYDGRTRPEWFIVDGPYSRALSAGWSSWKLAWPITKRSLVRLQLPLPTWARPQMRGGSTSYPPGTRAAPHKVPRVASAKGSRAPETEARCCPGSRERSGAFFFSAPSRTMRKNFRSATAGSGAHCGKREKIFQIPLACASPCAYIADRRRTSAPAAREERRPCRTELDLHPLAMGLLRPSRPRSPPVPIARGSSRTELRRTPLTPKYAAGKVPDAA